MRHRPMVPTADGFIVLSVGNDPTFERFCKVAGCEELLADERFQTNAARVTNRAHVTDTLNEITAKQTSAWWLENLERHSIGCGPINSLRQVFADPQVASRDMVLEITGNVAIPLDDGAGVRIDPFRLELPLEDAVVNPHEIRPIPLKNAVVEGKVQHTGLDMRIIRYEKTPAPRP